MEDDLNRANIEAEDLITTLIKSCESEKGGFILMKMMVMMMTMMTMMMMITRMKTIRDVMKAG